MAIPVFVLGAALIVGGLASLAAAINLVPTEMGLLYAISGVICLSASAVVLSIGALILTVARRAPRAIEAPIQPKGRREAQSAATPSAPTAALAETTDDVNFNRSGHLPSLRDVEEAIAHPDAAPQVVARYTAGGAKYAIFSDGAIEAETEEGAFRFDSMGDFKSYLAERKR